ncbi:TetR/AcrR family transcriptional regulator [Pengzhenrongella sp.]|jgi:AcrR family transcriptional regulator|uniref:TetR/AcrR family transcriptional regulator n=1 Tax=Pengzhenrongella sp. TaxID=2888820 RepID=UPI002F95582A
MTARPYHHGGLRAALVTQAEATLRTSGIDGLSLRELARELGVSHGAPQRHFRDKAALLDALAIEGFGRLNEMLARAADVDDGHAFAWTLTDVAVAYVRFATEDPALLDLMFTHKHQADASDELKAAANAGLACVVAMVERGQARGDLVDGDPQSIAMVLFATLQGITSFANADIVDPQSLDELTTYAVELLLGGLTPHPDQSPINSTFIPALCEKRPDPAQS